MGKSFLFALFFLMSIGSGAAENHHLQSPSHPPGWAVFANDSNVVKSILPRRLDVHSNDHTHVVTKRDVDWISSFKHLEKIHLTHCDMADIDLSAFQKLRKLHTIDVFNSNITDEQLHYLAGSPDLNNFSIHNRSLTLPSNHFAEQPAYRATLSPDLCKHFANTDKLQYFRLDSISLAEDSLKPIAHLSKLERLYLSDNQLPGQNFQYIAEMKNLEFLTIQHNPMDGDSLAHLAGHPKLHALSLDHTPLPDDALAHISQIPHLTNLSLGFTQITGEGFAHLNQLKILKALSLRNTPLNSKFLKSLAQHPSLETLYFDGTDLTDDDIPGILHLQKLPSISMQGVGISIDGFERLCREGNFRDIYLDRDFRAKHAGAIKTITETYDVNVLTDWERYHGRR